MDSAIFGFHIFRTHGDFWNTFGFQIFGVYHCVLFQRPSSFSQVSNTSFKASSPSCQNFGDQVFFNIRKPSKNAFQKSQASNTRFFKTPRFQKHPIAIFSKNNQVSNTSLKHQIDAFYCFFSKNPQVSNTRCPRNGERSRASSAVARCSGSRRNAPGRPRDWQTPRPTSATQRFAPRKNESFPLLFGKPKTSRKMMKTSEKHFFKKKNIHVSSKTINVSVHVLTFRWLFIHANCFHSTGNCCSSLPLGIMFDIR